MISKKITASIFGTELAAIILAIAMGFSIGNPVKYFGEFHFITWLSFAQLLILAVLSRKIFVIRTHKEKTHLFASKGLVWAILAFGFSMLALDEVLLIHEGIDKLIHIIFKIQETGLTDRIDDILILIYGVVAILILYSCKNELKKYKTLSIFLVYGFSMFFIMVTLDILTNRDDILAMIFTNNYLASILKTWLAITEESLKIFAEGIFMLGLFTALSRARQITQEEN